MDTHASSAARSAGRRLIPDSDALLTNGEILHIRAARAGDRRGVSELHSRVSRQTIYLRYFTASVNLERYLDRLLREEDEDHLTVVGLLRGEIIAVAGYERLDDPGVAEVAFLVDDAFHGLGVGTLLLEHLVAAAEQQGLTRFVAVTLPQNLAMLSVFRDAGFPIEVRHADGEVEVAFPVRPDERARNAADLREAQAEWRSLHAMLAPKSVVVVGAGRDPGGLGHRVAADLVAGGYAGPKHVVNRGGVPVAGLPAWSSLADVPDPVDLVVVVVPAKDVVGVARQAAERRARSLVVVSAGFAEAGRAGLARQRELLAVCRRAGMRLVGPNCMGIASNVDGVSLNATFASPLPPRGGVGMMSQSGAVGIAALNYAVQTGAGLSSFISAGNKADVSGNDLLCFWERDESTRVCALYLESFGNPRKFARIARRVGRVKPVVVVKAGRSSAGSRAARSHTAAAATSDVAVDALFEQSGVIRAETVRELFEMVTLLDRAPLPASNRVAVVGNSGGPAVLAVDACIAEGLQVPAFSAETRTALRENLPPETVIGNPIDLLAGASPQALRFALATVLADPHIDAAIAIHTPVLAGAEEAMAAAMVDAAKGSGKPVIAVFTGFASPPEALQDAEGRPILVFHPFPETAARALGAASRYAAWRARPAGQRVHFEVDPAPARAAVRSVLAGTPRGRWLDAAEATALVASYGIPVIDTRPAATAAEAAEVAGELAGPVALKAASGELVHKTELGAVRLGLAGADAVARAFTEMAHLLGSRMGGAVIQPMVEPGVETAVGLVSDPSFGPLVMFGLGGVASELLADRTFRILPMTREDARDAVRSLRASQLLFGYRGSPAVDVAALEEILLRLAQLAEDVPELVELDLNPVIARPGGACVVDVKARLAPVNESFPLLRRLRP